MDYKDKYNAALEKAKKFYEQGTITESLSYIFPELKENNEDEGIRKWLIDTIKSVPNDSIEWEVIDKSDVLAWLEKQGKPLNKPIFDAEDRMMLDAIAEGLHDTVDTYSWKNFGNALIDVILAWIKMKCKQKPFDYENANIQQKDFAPEVGPKFKVGDWILYSGDHYEGVRHITKIDENGYYIERNGLPHGIIPFNHEICMRLWTIKDAKDGDVLISQYNKPFIYNGKHDSFCIGSYGGIVTSDIFIVTTEKRHWTENVNIHPATKEQRDLLFAKMKEAGYEWDAKKKKLNKIEQEPA